MDEATSALNMELEAQLMSHALTLGITMINVAHRPSLMKYHTHLLKFEHGQGLGQGVVYTHQRLENGVPQDGN
jgi:ABC-type uncharacterized transport system fused permease/ATPase subunit